MRTTVNIDEHLLAEAKLIAARSHRTVGSVLEDALRKLLADRQTNTGATGERHLRLPSHGDGGLHPGVSLDDNSALADLLDETETSDHR